MGIKALLESVLKALAMSKDTSINPGVGLVVPRLRDGQSLCRDYGSKPLPGRAMVTRPFEYEAVMSRIGRSAAEIEWRSGRRSQPLRT